MTELELRRKIRLWHSELRRGIEKCRLGHNLSSPRTQQDSVLREAQAILDAVYEQMEETTLES